MNNYSASEGSEQPPLPQGGTAEWDPLRGANLDCIELRIPPGRRIPGWKHTHIQSTKTNDFIQLRVDIFGKVYAILLGNNWPDKADVVGYFTPQDILELYRELGEIVADIYRYSPPSTRIRYSDLPPELASKIRIEACGDADAEARFRERLASYEAENETDKS